MQTAGSDQKADKGKEKLLFVCYQDFKSIGLTMMPTVIMDKELLRFPCCPQNQLPAPLM